MIQWLCIESATFEDVALQEHKHSLSRRAANLSLVRGFTPNSGYCKA